MYYVISRDDIIYDLSPKWDQSAMEASCEDTFASRVKGTNLWSHIDGIETKSYLNALFFTCRQTGQSVRLNYRCDTPGAARLFRLVIVPLEKGGLRIEHQQVPGPKFSGSPTVVLDDRRPSLQCSQCLAVKVGDGWIDPMFVVPRADFPRKYIVCPVCRKAAIQAIGAWPKVVALTPMKG